jgi:FkbM family methyltransferase
VSRGGYKVVGLDLKSKFVRKEIIINKSFVENLTWRLTPRFYAIIFPVLNLKYRWPIKLQYTTGAMRVQDRQSDFSIVASRPARIRRYKLGVKPLLSLMLNMYCVDKLVFNSPPIVVDIGANIGEFSMGARSLLHSESRLICIEPDLVDYSALIQNIDVSKKSKNYCFNVALSNQAGELDFYLNNDSGDSSLIENKTIKKIVKVKVRTLDEIMDEVLESHEEISLVKLEAEGWEPEVLEGATITLHRTLYVAADLGPERLGESTHLQCSELLKQRGFSEILNRDHRYLFRNDRLISTKNLGGVSVP